jgi:ribosomal protein S4E
MASLSTTTLSTKQYSASIYKANTGQIYLEIDRGTLSFWGSVPDTTTFKNYFTTGSIAYSVNAANGIQIIMSDTGATWSTSNGSQTGSTFSIVAVKEQWISGNQYIKFLANFNCTLYDQNGLNPKTITNGVFLGYFENQ